MREYVATDTAERLRSMGVDDADRAVREAATWAASRVRPSAVGRPGAASYDTPARATHLTRPEYPKAAFEHRVEGTVELEILIGEDGRVVHAEVRKSIPELDAAAVATAKEWRFEPARLKGRPIASVATAPVAFRIF